VTNGSERQIGESEVPRSREAALGGRGPREKSAPCRLGLLISQLAVREDRGIKGHSKELPAEGTRERVLHHADRQDHRQCHEGLAKDNESPIQES